MVSDTVFKISKRKTAFLGPYLVYAKVEIWTGAEWPGFRRSWLWSVPWRSGAGRWRCPSPGPETRSPWRCPLWCPLGVWQKRWQRYDVNEYIPMQDSSTFLFNHITHGLLYQENNFGVYLQTSLVYTGVLIAFKTSANSLHWMFASLFKEDQRGEGGDAPFRH